MFDPTIGRWTTEDPIGFEAADADLFRYVRNNPTNAIDLSGLMAEYMRELDPLPEAPSSIPVGSRPPRGTGLWLRYWWALGSAGIPKQAQKEEAPPKTQNVKGNQYGDWKITQENESDVLGPYESRVTIEFIPNIAKVKSTEIAFIQIVRILDTKTGQSVGENRLGKAAVARMTAEGWHVDRQSNKKYGWYGYGNDGKPEEEKNVGLHGVDVMPVSPGSSPKPYKTAVLKDFPGDPNKTPAIHKQFEFETYAIAKAGKDKGTIYGGLSWGFRVEALSKMTSLPRSFLKQPSGQFKAAIALWDKQAKGPANMRNDPNQVPLGPDITFPK
jgi:uncharacterized protein RhaS with RHS repeats